MSRFGALSTVLFDMSDRWEEFTPPYILLLIRTFLTLEGVAGQVPLSLTLCVCAFWARSSVSSRLFCSQPRRL